MQALRSAVASLVFVVFVVPAIPASAGDDEPPSVDVDESRSAQRRRRRRRRRRPRRERDPEPAAEEPTPEATEEPAAEGEPTAEEGAEPASPEDASAELSAAAEGESSEDGIQTTGNLQRSNRMEFDARLVRGQTAGAGAVVLFNRGKRPLPPLTGERRGFSRQTVRDVLGTVDPEVEESERPRRRRRRARRRE
ncbi:MAG: hypothetical protein AAGE52_10420 [Myxococcota bacterium]